MTTPDTALEAELGQYKVDYLLLLVGGNPLPNAVAGTLLCSPGGTITLIHSKREESIRHAGQGSIGTFRVAQKLEEWFKHQGINDVRLTSVHESHSDSITQGVLNALRSDVSTKIGLNYTGGTKAMSVHAYRVVEQWTAEQSARGRHVQTVFSYLDARSLRMVFDPADGRSSTEVYIGRKVELELEDLLQLHGWTLNHKPNTQPILPATAQSLRTVYADQKTAKIWGKWLQAELLKKAKRPESISIDCPRSPDRQACSIEQPGEKWLSCGQLKKVELQWPSSIQDLQALAVMKTELQQKDLLNLGKAAETCGYKEPEDFCKWLNGMWLESAVLQELQQCANDCALAYVGMNLEPKTPVHFEFDVVAMRGYQLFAFSCSTDTEEGRGGKDRLKKKLFEAFIRARQLGGDEACVALVCCSDNPDGIESEMRRDIDLVGRIGVFGRQHLTNLSTHLSQWIQSQSGEEQSERCI